jgi:hypothetical protein
MALYYFYISHTDILVLNLTHNIRSHRDISKNEL